MTYSERTSREAAEDLVLRSRIGRWATKDLMLSADYSRARDLVRWPDRIVGPKSEVVERSAAYCDGSPKTFAQADHRSTYALRIELGQRAYEHLFESERPKSKVRTARVVRPRANALATRLDAEAARAERLRAFTEEVQRAGADFSWLASE